MAGESNNGAKSAAGPSEHDGYVEFVQNAILKRWKALLSSESGARAGEDIEALHDMRVASRRLRAALSVFGGRLPARRVTKAEKSLRNLTRALGASREWDVHGEALARLHAGTSRDVERAAIEHLMELVDARRGHERAAMLRFLDDVDLNQIGKHVRWLARHGRAGDGPEDLPHVALDVLAPLIHDAFVAVPRLREKERPEEMHTTRIAIKRLRYALELLAPAFEDGHDRLVAKTKALQEILGRHHDHILLEELLTRTLGRLSEHGRRALAEGLMGPIERFRRERRDRYEEFLVASAGLSAVSFAVDVRRGLLPGAEVSQSNPSDRVSAAPTGV